MKISITEEMFEEMSDALAGYVADAERDSKELSYLWDFIHHKGLNEEFDYFRQNAKLVYSEDEPLPRHTLK